MFRASWAVWSTLPITWPGESSRVISPPGRLTSGPAGSAARASSSLKSLKPASPSFRQNSDTVDTATSHSALKSVILIYWVSCWCSST